MGITLVSQISINTFAYTPEICNKPVSANILSEITEGQKILKNTVKNMEFKFFTGENVMIFNTSGLYLDQQLKVLLNPGQIYSQIPENNPNLVLNSNELPLGKHTVNLQLKYKCHPNFNNSISFEIVDKLELNLESFEKSVNCKVDPMKFLKSFNCSGRIDTKIYNIPANLIKVKYGQNGEAINCRFVGSGGNFGCDNIKIKNTDNQIGGNLYISFNSVNYIRSNKFIALK